MSWRQRAAIERWGQCIALSLELMHRSASESLASIDRRQKMARVAMQGRIDYVELLDLLGEQRAYLEAELRLRGISPEGVILKARET